MAEAEVRRWVDHPRETVWRALSDPVLAALWLPFEGYDPRVGHRFRARGPAGASGSCEILELDPPRRVVVAWEIGGCTGPSRTSAGCSRCGPRSGSPRGSGSCATSPSRP